MDEPNQAPIQPAAPPSARASAQSPVSNQSAAGNKENEAAPAAVESAGRVLLIEDDLPMIKMYSTKLQGENFEVETACDGNEGLQKAKDWLPDLVVLDLMIPKLGGMDILEQLRADDKTKDLPVIILSNLSQERDIERSRQLGVKAFLIKANFTPSQVVEKIKEHLGKQDKN